MEGLEVKFSSKGAQQDLAALEKAIDKTVSATSRMDKAFAAAAASANTNLTKAARAMEKYAQVAALLSKIKVAGNPAGQIKELAKALDSVGRARTIPDNKIASIRQLSVALNSLRMPEKMMGISTLLNSLGKARVPTAAQTRNLREFFTAISTFKGAPQSASLDRLLLTLGNLKAPNAGTIKRIEQMFLTLATAKQIPNASKIARDLDMIAAAAGRASSALRGLPSGAGGLGALRGVGGAARSAGGAGVGTAGQAAARGAGNLGSALNTATGGAAKANASFSMLGRGLTSLTGRFSLTYQAGTLLSTMFSAFTIGQFVKGIYDANIQFLKLQKAVLFATGTFSGAEEATNAYIGISQKLGLSIKDNIETYGRFVIASTASGIKLKQTNDVYESLATALTVVGSSAQQQQLAFYGLTEMMQKGVVYSKEFNRQIGAQLPGNAIIGAKALSNLRGHFVSVSEFFREMHTGMLQSAQFIPEWAKEVRKMYEPLLALAQQRPDVAITRLKNSFAIFAREVGNGKFMSAIGNEISAITGKMVEGEGASAHLTAGMEHLADALGQNLAGIIHSLGSGLQFLIDHIDQIIIGIKAFAGYELSKTLVGWGTSALKAAGSFQALASAITAARLASATTTKAGVPVSATASGIIAARNAAGIAPRNAGGALAAQTAVTSFGRRGLNAVPVTNTFGRVSYLSNGARGAGAAASVAEGAAGAEAGAAASGLGVLTAAGPAIALVAVGVGAFLFAISGLDSKLKTATGSLVTYGDIEKSFLNSTIESFKSIGDDIGGGILSVGKAIGNFFGITVNGGDMLLAAAAAIRTGFADLYSKVSIPARFIFGVFKTLIELIYAAVKSAFELISGHPFKAKETLSSAWKDLQTTWGDFVAGAKKDLKGADFGTNFVELKNGAAAIADERGKREAENASSKQIEAALQQNAAAEANMRAATLMNDVLDQFKKDTQTIDYDRDIAPRIKALISGEYGTQNGPKNPIAMPAMPDNVPPEVVAKLLATNVDSPTVMLGTGKRLFDTASQHIGETEKNDKATLQDLFKVGGINIDPKMTAWCAAFVNSVLATNGLKTTGSLAASSFAKYGEAVKTPHQGDIVVLKPEGKDSTGHVGFFNGTNKNGSISVIGGNQGDSVNASNFKASDVLSYRRPTEIDTSSPLAARMKAQGPLDTQASDVGADVDSGPTETEADKVAKSRLQEYKSIQSFIAGASPSAGVLAADQERLANLLKIVEKEEAFAAKFGAEYKTVFTGTQNEIAAANKKYAQDEADALDPMAKLNRLNKEAYAIDQMRAAGLSDEADYQAKINDLVNSGEERTRVANAAAHKENLEIAEHNRHLASQIDLQKIYNDLKLQSIQRAGTTTEAIVAQSVMGHQGKDYADKLAQSKADGTYNDYLSGANATVAQRRKFAASDISDSLSEEATTSHLSETQRRLREDYRTFLQDLTGDNDNSIDRLNAKYDDATKELAMHSAKMKEELENPPGFQRWVDGLKPLSDRLEDIKANFAEDLSSGITDSLMGDKVDIGAMAKDLRRQWMKAQTDTLVASAFGSLGITTPQTPEQQMTNATGVFSDSTAKFGQYVDNLGLIVGGASGAASSGYNGAEVGITPEANFGGNASGYNGEEVGITPEANFASLFGGGGSGGYSGEEVGITPEVDFSKLLGGGSSAAASGGGFLDGIFGGSGAGASGGGILSSIFGSASGGAAGGGIGGMLSSLLGGASGAGGAAGGIGGMLGNIFGGGKKGGGGLGNLLLGGLGLLGGLFDSHPDKPKTYHNPAGIIGNMSQNTVTGTSVAGHSNVIGDLLNMAVQMAMFKEGGYTDAPVSKMAVSGLSFANAPHYAEGTSNTSGIPAIVHPNEAIVPLSRNRKIPVEGGTGTTHVTSNITVISPDADSFRKSSGAITREQNRTLKRAATRNLTNTK